MSADRFYNSIENPGAYAQNAMISLFVYYLTVEQGAPYATKNTVSQCFIDCDLTPPTRIATYLSEGITNRPQWYVKVEGGYRLHKQYSLRLSTKLGDRRVVVQTSAELRQLETLFTDGPTRSFLVEAINCFEAGANRAALIMVWLLTFDHFLSYVFTKKLADFNVALTAKPVGKLTKIVNRVDFSDINEDRIIELCRTAKIISNDVQKILKDGLGTRNTAAHPSDVTVARSKAISVIEDLVTNVIKKF